MSLILCPACGHDDCEELIGGYCCLHCGHVFTVINGQDHQISDEDDDDGA